MRWMRLYYHVWFGTRWRKWILDGEFDEMVKQAIRDVSERHGIRLLECETMIDHVHLLVDIDEQAELSDTMKLLKGGSSRAIGLISPEYKLDAHTNHLWQKRYGSRPVGAGEVAAVREYIRSQKERPEKYER